ncbi:MAG TPA: hypothetical protein VI110_07640 [Lapillicoccus sp.]
MTPIQETPRKSLSRRTVLGAAAGVALIPITASGGAAEASARGPFLRNTVPLPDGLRPEGITSGPGFTFYVGSLADGRIVTGNLLFGPTRTLLPGAAGRQIRGLYWDARTNWVWAVGNVGSEAHIWAVDARTGAIEYDRVVAGAVFLNDLVVTRTRVFVTDSRVDRLVVIGLQPNGRPVPNGLLGILPLSGAWPANTTATNANGIRELRDGSLVLNNSRVGGLWQVDPNTGVTTEIPVSGGPGITGGDGLELKGSTLYNVRGSAPNQVAVLRLSRTRSGWTATWVRALTDPSLDVPSTATLAGPWLWAVNARFGVTSPGTAPYWITRLPAR